MSDMYMSAAVIGTAITRETVRVQWMCFSEGQILGSFNHSKQISPQPSGDRDPTNNISHGPGHR